MGKKVLAVLLAILMIFSYNVAVDAATLTTNGETVEVPVKYTVNNTEFVITVPAEITLDNADVNFAVTAEKMNLRPDETVVVSISEGCDSYGAVALVRQNDTNDNPAKLYTYLTVDGINVAAVNYEIGVFTDSENSTENTVGHVTMSAPDITENTKAGDYIGTLEFQIELRRE